MEANKIKSYRDIEARYLNQYFVDDMKTEDFKQYLDRLHDVMCLKPDEGTQCRHGFKIKYQYDTKMRAFVRYGRSGKADEAYLFNQSTGFFLDVTEPMKILGILNHPFDVPFHIICDVIPKKEYYVDDIELTGKGYSDEKNFIRICIFELCGEFHYKLIPVLLFFDGFWVSEWCNGAVSYMVNPIVSKFVKYKDDYYCGIYRGDLPYGYYKTAEAYLTSYRDFQDEVFETIVMQNTRIYGGFEDLILEYLIEDDYENALKSFNGIVERLEHNNECWSNISGFYVDLISSENSYTLSRKMNRDTAVNPVPLYRPYFSII